MEKISWTNRVKNEVLQKVRVVRNSLQTVKGMKANWVASCVGTASYITLWKDR
jgi:hypothetical protein